MAHVDQENDIHNDFQIYTIKNNIEIVLNKTLNICKTNSVENITI